MSDQPLSNAQFVLCVQNDGYEVDLELQHVYRRLPDPLGERRGFFRVIDETGEDFLFPRRFFVPVDPAAAEQSVPGAVLRAS